MFNNRLQMQWRKESRYKVCARGRRTCLSQLLLFCFLFFCKAFWVILRSSFSSYFLLYSYSFVLFSMVAKQMITNLAAWSNTRVLAHSCIGQKSGVVWRGSLTRDLQDWSQGIGWAEFSSEGLGENLLPSSFLLLADFSSLGLEDWGLLCWLSAGGPFLAPRSCPRCLPRGSLHLQTSNGAPVPLRLQISDVLFCDHSEKTLLLKGWCDEVRPTWIISLF